MRKYGVGLGLAVLFGCSGAPDAATSGSLHGSRPSPTDPGGRDDMPTTTTAECGDIASSVDNCGACGHRCREGLCKSGRCEAIVIAGEETAPRGITVVSGAVYWTAEGTNGPGSIRALAPGGQPTTLADGLGAPADIVAADGTLYWTNWLDNRTVMALDLPAGTPRKVVGIDSGGSEHLVASGDRIFWAVNPITSGAAHYLYSAKRDGTDLKQHAANTTADLFGGPVVAGGRLFWSERKDPGNILQASFAGEAGVPLQSAQGTPNHLIADADSLYWSVEAPSRKIVRIPLAGGASITVADSVPAVDALAVDATTVYLASGAAKKILAIPKRGGDVRTLVDLDSLPMELFVDDGFVYWTFRQTDKRGGVAKVSK